MINEMFILDAVKDSMIVPKLRYFYYKIIYENFDAIIYIKLKNKVWYSANSLNFILTFIEALLSKKADIKISIDLFEEELIDQITFGNFYNGNFIDNNEIIINTNEIYKMKSKFVFYDVLCFSELLYQYNTNVKPSPARYDGLKKKLEAYPFERFWRNSSKILSLSKLIKNELEQKYLSLRIETMTNILKRNLYGRISDEEAKDDSEQIMYEMVKNIYQHSELNTDNVYVNNGFACAQINKYPNSPKWDLEKTKMLFFNDGPFRKEWRFLTITINDFGVGLVNKIRKSLLEQIKDDGFECGRFFVDNEFIKSDYNLMLLAITTDFSTKYFEQEEKFLEHKLANKGFGFVFCISFIAKKIGRMEIRSGASKLTIIAKDEAYKYFQWNNTGDANSLLQQKFDSFFDVFEEILSEDEAKFPGTQLIIEIPVEVIV